MRVGARRVTGIRLYENAETGKLDFQDSSPKIVSLPTLDLSPAFVNQSIDYVAIYPYI